MTAAARSLALTVYDMTKALDKISILELKRLCLVEKTGGKSGDYRPESREQ